MFVAYIASNAIYDVPLLAVVWGAIPDLVVGVGDVSLCVSVGARAALVVGASGATLWFSKVSFAPTVICMVYFHGGSL